MKTINIHQLLSTLESSPYPETNLMKEVYNVFISDSQKITDLYLLVANREHKGFPGFAIIALFGRCINDLLVSFHLARHGYGIQSYGVLRGIWEALDKIALFKKDSKWAEVWINDPEKARKKLTPAGVRELLGEERFDPIYSFISVMGSHPTFQSTKTFMAKRVTAEKNDKPKISLWIGGVMFEHEIVFTHSWCLYALQLILSKLLMTFPNILIKEVTNLKAIVQSSAQNFINFGKKHIVAFADEQGLKPQPEIESLFEDLDKMLNLLLRELT